MEAWGYVSGFTIYKEWEKALTRRPSRDRRKVVAPKCIMSLSVVKVHVSKLSNVQITEVVLVKLIPGDIACPIRCWYSAIYSVNLILASYILESYWVKQYYCTLYMHQVNSYFSCKISTPVMLPLHEWHIAIKCSIIISTSLYERSAIVTGVSPGPSVGPHMWAVASFLNALGCRLGWWVGSGSEAVYQILVVIVEGEGAVWGWIKCKNR